MVYVYPKVEIEESDKIIVFRTRLVKEHEGKYYYYHIMSKFKTENPNGKMALLNLFHDKVYRTIIFGKVDLSLRNPDGSKAYELASLQVSEKERLVSLF